MPHKTYATRKSKLLKDFDRALARVKNILFDYFGEDEGIKLMQESHQQYEELIPQIPYIGDRNPFLIFLLPTTRYLAIYLVFKKHGRTIEEIGDLVYKMGEAEILAIPKLVRRLVGVLWFSPWLTKRIQKRALISQSREYSGDFVLNYVAGGQDFEWGVDYIECANCKFLDKHGAVELKPYICFVDKFASEMLGWGLRRTETLAEGGMRCDFRFKKGGETRISKPAVIDLSG